MNLNEYIDFLAKEIGWKKSDIQRRARSLRDEGLIGTEYSTHGRHARQINIWDCCYLIIAILAGVRGSDEEYKGITTEYSALDLIGNTELFKILYRGGYDIEAYIMPHSSTVIPIAKNQLYNENSEETLIRCIADLMDNHEANEPKGEVFSESAYRTG